MLVLTQKLFLWKLFDNFGLNFPLRVTEFIDDVMLRE